MLSLRALATPLLHARATPPRATPLRLNRLYGTNMGSFLTVAISVAAADTLGYARTPIEEKVGLRTIAQKLALREEALGPTSAV